MIIIAILKFIQSIYYTLYITNTMKSDSDSNSFNRMIKYSKSSSMTPIPTDQQIQDHQNQQQPSQQSPFTTQENKKQKIEQNKLVRNGKFMGIIFIIFLILWALFDKKQVNEQHTDTLHNFMLKSYNKVRQNPPKQYIGISKVKPYQQLPFCIIIKPQLSKQQKLDIIVSLTKQQYENYAVGQIDETQQYYTYKTIINKIQKQCTQYSILLFLSQSLVDGALNKMNQQYQVYNMWMAYSEIKKDNNKIVVILSMYVRLFRLLTINDFYGEKDIWINQKFNNQQTNMYFVNAVFQLCLFNAANYAYQNVHKNRDIIQLSQLFISAQLNQQNIYKGQTKKIVRIPYQPLLSLSQEGFVNIKSLLAKRQQFYKSNITLKLPDLFMRMQNQVSHLQFQQLLQLQQLIFLSPKHSLYKIDQIRMEQKYHISKYADISKQKPICLVILSHNNIQNNRYKKAIQSIVLQKYENYHIVFVDDLSTDETGLKTKQYLKSINFPPQKITFVRNLKQKKATYNYINTGFNFCGQDQIQLIFDGDDQLIGQYVLQFVNVQYSQSPIWVMHSFYKDDRYQEGFTLPSTSDYIYNFLGRRKWIFFFSPLRSWLVKLLRKLPTREHLQPFTNQYFSTMCDSALQYGLYEIAGDLHSKYVPQINYLYTSPIYTGNENSHFFVYLKRDFIHFMTSLRSPLKKADNLNDLPNNSQLQQILLRDKDKEYQVLAY